MIAILAALTLSSAAADSVASAPCSGPLVPGSIGLGFRVLGDAPEIIARVAFSPRWSVGLSASGSGSYISHEGTATERTRTSFRVALPFEAIPACRGNVCATVGAGPFYALSYTKTQDDASNIMGSSYSQSSGTLHTIGLTTSVGARWEFVPGFALAASWGLDAYGIIGEDAHGVDSWDGYRSHEEISGGFGASSWNGGVGIDAWF